jgi:proteic killer suppression protein
LEKLFYDGTKKGIKPEHAKRLEDILDRLNAAVTVEDVSNNDSKETTTHSSGWNS